jgi:spermidine/putrescine-binding protein
MKRFTALVLTVVLAAGLLAGCGANDKKKAAIEKYGSDTLKVYMPTVYIDEDVVPNFEKEFGVKVIVELFDSNEMMYTKLQAGDSYDLLIPSDYMIERLMNEKMLQKIDKSLIPNMSVLVDQVKDMSYDPGNEYSVPYFWGNVGIVYNTKNVSPEKVEAEGFSILKNPEFKGHIYLYDSERDSFMVALKALGYSMNSDNEAELNAAYDWLVNISKTMEPAIVGDEVIDNMMTGAKDIAVVYSGDAVCILDENEDMSFFAPNEGTNLWVDACVIPANAANPKLAHEFINYLLSDDVAYANTEEVGYASPNKTVLEKASKELFDGNVAYIPRQGYAKDEVFHDNEVIRKKISELWIKVKAAK